MPKQIARNIVNMGVYIVSNYFSVKSELLLFWVLLAFSKKHWIKLTILKTDVTVNPSSYKCFKNLKTLKILALVAVNKLLLIIINF